LLKNKKDKKKEAKMTPFEIYEAKKREKKVRIKEAGKIKRENEKKLRNMTEAEIKEMEDNRKALSFLVSDVPDDESDMDFKA
jgi:hypothetical protein